MTAYRFFDRYTGILTFLLLCGILPSWSGCEESSSPAPYIRVKITSPANGSALSQPPTRISVTTEASCGCQQLVEFRINGVLAYTDYAAPYEYNWDHTGLQGTFTVRADGILVGKATGADSIRVTIP